jgi:hypothetical protein
VNEYKDQEAWYEVYALHPEAFHPFQRRTFIEDFDTWGEAEAFASGYFSEDELYLIKHVSGLDVR